MRRNSNLLSMAKGKAKRSERLSSMKDYINNICQTACYKLDALGVITKKRLKCQPPLL